MKVAPGPAYRIAFAARFWATTRIMRGRMASSIDESPSTTSATPARAARSSSSDTTASSSGRTGTGAEHDDPRPRLELAEEQHLVDQLPDLLDLGPRPVDEVRDVLAGKGRSLEQGKEARERRAKLVRDRGREACAQLLVRREVAAAREVHQPFPASADIERNDERDDPGVAREDPVRKPLALREPGERLPSPPAGGDHAIVRVEHDHRLAALLEQHPAPGGVGVHADAVVTETSRVAGAPARADVGTRRRSPPGYHPFTSRQPRSGLRGTTIRLALAKILIIEDDDVIAQGMARHLQAAGYDAVGVANGETGLARLRYERPDVCVLDLMLPGVDGWKVIEQARGEGIGTPIVVVSARGTEHDRVHALEIGADDYLVKPFSMKELVARVGAAARRGTRAQDPRRGEEIVIEELRLDPKNVQAYVDGKSADLTPTEFRLLYALALEHGARAHPRRAPAASLGASRVAPRSHGRRLRPQAAREDRPPRVAPHVPPDALRRRLQARARSQVARGGGTPSRR